jgi:LmbE family N-acetylglucosaminyl deacetylase
MSTSGQSAALARLEALLLDQLDAIRRGDLQAFQSAAGQITDTMAQLPAGGQWQSDPRAKRVAELLRRTTLALRQQKAEASAAMVRNAVAARAAKAYGV